MENTINNQPSQLSVPSRLILLFLLFFAVIVLLRVLAPLFVMAFPSWTYDIYQNVAALIP